MKSISLGISEIFVGFLILDWLVYVICGEMVLIDLLIIL